MEENRKTGTPGDWPRDQGRRNQDEMDQKKGRNGMDDLDQNISNDNSGLPESDNNREGNTNRPDKSERDTGAVL